MKIGVWNQNKLGVYETSRSNPFYFTPAKNFSTSSLNFAGWSSHMQILELGIVTLVMRFRSFVNHVRQVAILVKIPLYCDHYA